MPPQSLTLIRHAQGFHNLCEANHQLRDPQLTDLGKKQCAALSTSLPHLLSITLIVASPIKRTLYTALYTFATLLKQNPSMRIIALPDLQETSALPCDTGSDIPDLIEEFEGQPVDFSLLFEGWNEKSKAPYAPIPGLILARAGRVRKWLSEREEKEIAVVTHGGLLHFLTGDWSDHEIFPGRRRVFLNSGNVEGEGERAGVEGNGKGKQKEVLEEEVEWEYDLSRDGVPITGTGWTNCEYRVYALDTSSPEKTADAALLETKESMRRRKGHQIPLTEAEQRNLADAATRNWVAQGILKESLQVAESSSAEGGELERVTSQEAAKAIAVKA